jgi:hypothetical protein
MEIENNIMQPNTLHINNTMNNQNRALTDMTYRELKDYARGKIRGYTNYTNKQDLIDFIRMNEEFKEAPLPYELYVKQLSKKQLLRELNIKSTKETKEQLIKRLLKNPEEELIKEENKLATPKELEKCTMEELRKYCRLHKVPKYWKYTIKKALIQHIRQQNIEEENQSINAEYNDYMRARASEEAVTNDNTVKQAPISRAGNTSSLERSDNSYGEYMRNRLNEEYSTLVKESVLDTFTKPKDNSLEPINEADNTEYDEYMRNRQTEEYEVPEKTEETKKPAKDGESTEDILVQLVEEAYKSRLLTWNIINRSNKIKDIESFLDIVDSIVISKINQALDQHNSVKVNIKLFTTYEHEKTKEMKETNFKTRNKIILKSTDLNKYYDKCKSKLITESQNFQREGSAWRLINVNFLQLRTNKYNPMRASSYIDLSEKLKLKKAYINIKNEDNKCFLWSVIAALHPAEKNPQRVSVYKPYETLFDDVFRELNIQFPAKIDDIKKFESKTNLSINVYTLNENEDVIPLRITKKRKQEGQVHINLLYITDGNNSHYVLIKNKSRAFSSQYSKNHQKIDYCDRCLQPIKNKDKDTHEENCRENAPAKIKMPHKGEFVRFKNIKFTQRLAFAVYADFESLLLLIGSCINDPANSYTYKYQKHIPCGFCYYIVYSNGTYKEPVIYRGLDAQNKFIECIRKEVAEISYIYDEIEDIFPLTEEEQLKHNNNERCVMCNRAYINEVCKCTNKNCDKPHKLNRKVRHHDHLTGKYISTVCNSCNFQLKLPNFVPVILHNLAGYDAHLFVKSLNYDMRQIDLLPNSDEKYISFTKYTDKLKIRFIDSFKFLGSSLDSLAKVMNNEGFTSIKNTSPKNCGTC